MRYVSTRGQAPALEFDDTLLSGMAADGGLYVPEAWPSLDAGRLAALAGRPYAEVAAAVMAPFVAGSAVAGELPALAAETYGGFEHSAVAPLVQVTERLWVLELFHGPTLAFKDYALQLLGRLFDRVLARHGRRATIIGATSGDTGSAAIEACRGREALDIFILYPKGRVSPVQRRQMTTVDAANVHTLAIDGSFDDCQDLVKALFADAAFREEASLAAVNSINWARIMAQTVYYVTAALALGAPDRRPTFVVPTGNFGNVYAGYVAAAMGLPVERFVVGTNRNDILHRAFTAGEMRAEPVVETLSPAMDIQISSNFERLLFDLFDRDGAELARRMQAFRQTGAFDIGADRLTRTCPPFASRRVDDNAILAEIARTRAETGLLVDPHSAVGLAAARAATAEEDDGGPVVSLACAHPAKFPEAVERATGVTPSLPPRLADLFDRPERQTELPADITAVRDFIRAHSGATGAPA